MVARDSVALDNRTHAFNVFSQVGTLFAWNCEIHNRHDASTNLHRIDMCVIPDDDAEVFKPADALGNSG